MPEDQDIVAAGRLARWIVFVVALVVAIAFYFRAGRSVPPLAAPAAISDTAR